MRKESGPVSEIHSVTKAALPTVPPGWPPRTVVANVGIWAPTSIRHALRELVKSGEIERTGESGSYRYWRRP